MASRLYLPKSGAGPGASFTAVPKTDLRTVREVCRPEFAFATRPDGALRRPLRETIADVGSIRSMHAIIWVGWSGSFVANPFHLRLLQPLFQ